jgi:hypothetical protein
MKKVKDLKKLIVCLTVFLSTAGCLTEVKKVEESIINWIAFQWVTDEVEGRVYEKAGINVPVQIGSISDPFTMQFDLGANLTMLYGRTFAPYLSSFPDLQNSIDTINGFPYLANTTFIVDHDTIPAFSFFYEENFGQQIEETAVGDQTVKHIGTIGANLLKDKVLIIDYPAMRLAITDSIPTNYQTGPNYIDLSLDRWGRVHLPIQVNGEVKKVLFDTGASMFPLLTSSENWKIFTDTIVQDSVLTSTWGEQYYTYAANAQNISIGDRELQDKRVFDAQRLSNFIKEENIWGVMGNAHFFNDVVIIDFKNLKFGWLEI